MNIREMKLDDYDRVYSIWEKADIILKDSDELAEISRMISRNPETCLVGLKEGKIIAAVMGGFDGRRGYVHHLAVEPSYQGQGYGRRMMEELLQRFKEMRVIKVHLFVEKNNKEVIGFYKKIGFKQRHDLVDLSKKLI